MGGFGSLFDKLKEVFGKSYLLGGFLPVTVFLVVNWSIGAAVFPVARSAIQEWLDGKVADQVTIGLVLLLVVAIFGFVLWSLNPWFREVFEGRRLPNTVRQRMTAVELSQAEALRHQVKALRPDVVQFRRQRGESAAAPSDPTPEAEPLWTECLAIARQAGEAAVTAQPPADLTPVFEPLRTAMARAERVPFASLETLFVRLEAELRVHSANSHRQLSAWQQEFRELLAYADSRTQTEYSRLEMQLWSRYPRELGIEPTLAGNISELHRDYGLTRYELDTGAFWLHLQKLAMADGQFKGILESGKLQLDFSVGLTVVMLATTIVWMGMTMFVTPSLSLYLTVVSGCWLLTGVSHGVMIQNYFAYSAVVRAAVDLFRFDLLKALHIGLPATLADERKQWRQLVIDIDPANTIYAHEDDSESGDDSDEEGEDPDEEGEDPDDNGDE